MTTSRQSPLVARPRARVAALRWLAIGLGALALLLSACSDEAKEQIGEAIEGVETGPGRDTAGGSVLSLIHISEPTRPSKSSRMPSSA